MFRPKGTTVVILVVGLLVSAPLAHAQQAEPTAAEAKQAEREAMYYRYLEFPSYVKGGSVEPHWMADGSSFWYAEGAPANTVIWKVDPKTNPSAGPLGQARGKLRAGTKTPLFDTARLRRALTPVLGHEPPYKGLPFDKFTFVDEGEKTVRFTVENKEFILQLDAYTITRVPALSEEEKSRLTPKSGEVLSPDGKWFATVKDYNLWLRSTYDGRSVPITTDGIEDYEWGRFDYFNWNDPGWAWWSPDSSKIAVKKLDVRQVEKIPVVHWLTSPEQVEWVAYPRAGKPLPQSELFIVDIRSKKKIRADTGSEPDQFIQTLVWRTDGSELLFLRANRSLKEVAVMAADPNTGATRVILSETQKTYVSVWQKGLFTLLPDGKRFIWMSERDGWNHLYLYDLGGTLLARLTQGAFPVVRVVTVDEKAGWVYFTAHGDQQRPYDIHLYRVNLKGRQFTRLTQAPGQHEAQFDPAKQFFLDTHSSIERPPVVELRQADGTLLQILSRIDIRGLVSELKWRPPEEFVVKAADGKTDLYGVLYKPYDFDPNKKYPVVDHIYPGRSVVPHTFVPEGVFAVNSQARAQLGFITFIVDNRGTSERGKAFEDVGYYSKETIADHVVTLRQLAQKRPYMDLGRVGIFGHSAGGYAVLRAMLLYPDVYHVGISASPGAEPLNQLYDDFELLLGPPQENKKGWEEASNVRLADNLQGKLLLVHGTSDVITPFSHMMKMVDALIRADKRFDLLVVPGGAHSYSETTRPYVFEAIRRYFQEHLKP